MNPDLNQGLHTQPEQLLVQAPREVVESFGEAYENWRGSIITHAVSLSMPEGIPIIVEGPSGSGKRLVLSQIAGDLRAEGFLSKFGHYHFGLGKGLRIARDLGWITHPPGHIPKEQYARVAKLMLFLGTAGMQVLPKPFFLYCELVGRTSWKLKDGIRMGIDRDTELEEYLISSHQAFTASLNSDWDISEIALDLRGDIDQLDLCEIKGRMEKDRVVDDLSPEEIKDANIETGSRKTRNQQDLTTQHLVYSLIRRRVLSHLQTFGSFKEFSSRFSTRQDWVEFYRDNVADSHLSNLYQGKRPEARTVLVNHKLDEIIHINGSLMEDMVEAVEREVQRPEFMGYKMALQGLKLAA